MLDSAILVRRQETPLWLSATTYAAGLIVGLVLATVTLVWVGVPFKAVINELVVEAFFTMDGLKLTTTSAIPLILVGVSTAIAMQVRFINIGIEGQLWLGAMAATWVAVNDIGPESTRLFLMLFLAFIAGALWIALPLLLKLRWQVNEVITTLLLGNVAFLLVQHQLFGVWRDPTTGFPISQEFGPSEMLSLIGWGNVHTGLWLALAAGIVCWFLMDHTRLGFYARTVGLNPAAAKGTGMPVFATISAVVLGAGGLCGLAGAVIVAGTEHRLNQSIGAGYLFSGIVIAYLARAQPIPSILFAFVLGGIVTAGNVLKVFYSVSEAVVILIQGTVLMSVLISQFFSTYHITRPVWRGAA